MASRKTATVKSPARKPQSGNILQRPIQGHDCPVARFLGALDGPWATLIVRELLVGPCRFGELQTRLLGISPKTLTDRLRKLESFGVLTRTDHGEIPPKVVYELTKAGHEVESVLIAMATWADVHLPSEAAREPRPRSTPRRLR
jgi:DNA-binding HxlR family transcriptional regulator